MRFACLVLLGLVACSGSSSSDPASTVTSATPTASAPPSSSPAPAPPPPPGTDAGAQVDASPCSSPSGCGASQVCCGTIPITGGTVPNCTTGAITTVCAAASACTTKLGMSCSGTQRVRLCKTNADCTESGDKQCCTFGDADAGAMSFCANDLVAAFGGGQCQ